MGEQTDVPQVLTLVRFVQLEQRPLSKTTQFTVHCSNARINCSPKSTFAIPFVCVYNPTLAAV